MAAKRRTYELLTDDSPLFAEVMGAVDTVRSQWHHDTASARVAVLWKHGVKPNRDGKLMLGQMGVAGALERELHSYDAKLILNFAAWPTLSELQRLALCDHEFCHLSVDYDKHGDPKYHIDGCQKFRLRGHFIEEFPEVVERHGLWKSDVVTFARVCRTAQLTLPFDGLEAAGLPAHSADPRGVTAALERLVDVSTRGGTIGVPVGKSATLTPADGDRIRRPGRARAGAGATA